ncbi:MAG: hypothetical protein JNL98_23625 [Bryobacterales bacterium]|nr:hypothetical protein [Bryobacterales bacterium]
MRTLNTLTIVTGMALLSIPALANEQLRTISDHARTVQGQAEEINMGLKKKSLTDDALKSKLDTSAASLEQLKNAVAELESSNSNVASLGKDWQLLKDKVQLLAIFHERKSELLTDVNRNRSMIRAHADGIAKRAAMLQQTVSRIQKSMPASASTAAGGGGE